MSYIDFLGPEAISLHKNGRLESDWSLPNKYIILTATCSSMDNRVEKWIGNVHGRSNQNVWGAASPFEAIRVDGSQ